MIEDVSDLQRFLATDEAALTSVRMGGVECYGLKIRNGHVIVRDGHALPVIDGRTMSAVFGESIAHKYIPLLKAPVRPTRELSSALVVQGSTNYYHFVVFNLPALLLLKSMTGDRVTLATVHGFPASAKSLIADLLPVLSGGRAVDTVVLTDADYSARDVIFRVKPRTEVAVEVTKALQKVVLQAAGITDPLRAPGAVKLFVRRAAARNGRNLVNQDEVEAWFAARGYEGVDPGALTMEQQMLLFSRATRIVGVEGAALTNLLFAPHATQLLVLASPNIAGDIFFSELADACKISHETIYGDVANAKVGDRAADFTIPLQKLRLLEHRLA